MKAFFLFLAALVGSESVAPGQEAKLFELPAGQNYSLVEAGDELSARVPIRPLVDEESSARWQMLRRDVFSADGRPSALTSMLTSTFEPATAVSGPSIVMKADAGELLPGTYTLVLEFNDGDPTKKMKQSVSITLQRFGPQLSSPRKLNAWQEHTLFSTIDTPGVVHLREDGHKAAARELSIVDLRNPVSTNDPETGELRSSLTTAYVPAGGELEVELKPTGRYPLGKSTGKLLIYAKNMAAPLSVDYEVTAVRPIYFLLFSAISGALCGWLSRTFLQGKRDLAKARVTSSQAKTSLTEARATIPDGEFSTALKSADEALSRAVANESRPQKIIDAANAAIAALAEAKKQFETRRNLFLDGFVPQYKCFQLGWDFPDAVVSKFVEAKKIAEEIMSLSRLNDISAADRKLSEEMAPARLELVKQSVRWRIGAGLYLIELAKFPPALPAQGGDRLKEAVTAWRSQFVTNKNPVSVDSAELQKELDTLHAAYFQIQGLAADLEAGGKELTDWVRRLLASSYETRSLEMLEEVAAKQSVALHFDLRQPEDKRNEPEKRFAEQCDVWIHVLARPGLGAEFQSAIEEGRWTDAATAAQSTAAGSTRGLGIVARGKPIAATSEISAPVSRGFGFHTGIPGGASRDLSGLFSMPPLSGSTAELAELERTERAAALLQTVILSLVFTSLVYTLYGSQWIGTAREMIGIFIWAYGIDIAADSLAPLVSKAAPARAGAAG